MLPDDPTQVVSADNKLISGSTLGKDIVAASGLTFLVADNKSGLAIIVNIANYLATPCDLF